MNRFTSMLFRDLTCGGFRHKLNKYASKDCSRLTTVNLAASWLMSLSGPETIKMSTMYIRSNSTTVDNTSHFI